MKLTFEEPRKPGRPVGTGGDHSKALAAMAEEICERRTLFIRSAARIAHKETRPDCSVRHLRRLYARDRAIYEEGYLAERDASEKGFRFEEDQDLLRDYRRWLTPIILEEAEEAGVSHIIERQRIPIQRWWIEELEEFAEKFLGREPGELWDSFSKTPF